MAAGHFINLWTIWIVAGVCTDVTVGQVTFKSNVNGINFQEVEPVIMSVAEAGWGIVHMELDLWLPGNILYIDSHSIKTLNLTTMTSSLIAGKTEQPGYREGSSDEARFYNPYSFYQQNASQVVIVDCYNYCIRSISRLTNSTSWIAGTCTQYGTNSGDSSFESAQFAKLAKIVKLPRDDGSEIALVSSYTRTLFYGKIRVINFDEKRVSTLQNRFGQLFGLTIRPDTQFAYFAYSGGLGKVRYTNADYFDLMSSPYSGWSHLDGPLDSARLGQWPETLLFIDSNTMLIADYDNSVLRVADLELNYMTTICKKALGIDGIAGAMAGNVTHCQLFNPRSLLVLPNQNKILIGSEDSLGLMTVTGLQGGAIATTYPTKSLTEPTPQIPGETTSEGKTQNPIKPHPTDSIPNSNTDSQSTASGKDSINMQTVIIAAAVAGAFVIIGILAALIIYRVCSRRKERQLQERRQRQYNLYVDPAIALNDLTLTQNNTESETPSQYYNM